MPTDLKWSGRFRQVVETAFKGDGVAVATAQMSQRLDDVGRFGNAAIYYQKNNKNIITIVVVFYILKMTKPS